MRDATSAEALAEKLVAAWVEYSTGRAASDRNMKDALHATIDLLRSQSARIEEMERALEPFAEAADAIDAETAETNKHRVRTGNHPYGQTDDEYVWPEARRFNYGNFRAARAARKAQP